ncbi:general substrate transporter [Aspergillus minisclerotigenes]|uniref:General substrate transporter n=1 Tax=Aspergillus minisclerotigenes TaxID=656917 RepID=A0A5N6JHC7_9EURO|nr:general substrate transporter [Aspergillus minisclerotigenes]
MSLFGYDQGLFSGVVVTEDFLVVHDVVGTSKTKTLSTVTAIYDVGCFFGALVAFGIGERLVRKKSILLGTTLMAIGILLKCTSYSLPQIFVGRVILGYVSEISAFLLQFLSMTKTSSPKWRGKLVFLEMVMNILGFSVVNRINCGLPFAGGAVAWQFPIALQFMFIFVLFATVPWAMASRVPEETIEILSCIEDKPIDDPYVVAQKNEIEYTIYYERENAIRWRDILLRRKTDSTDSKSLRRLILGAGTQFMQQFEVNSVTYPICTCCAVGLIERMGGRGLMMLSTAGQFFAFLIITILLRYAEANAELNSLQMWNKGAAVGRQPTGSQNFVMVEITPIGFENIGWKFCIVWTVFNAAFLPVIYFFYPETANRTLEDIDAYYRSNPSLIVIKDPDAISVKRPLKHIEHEDHEMKKIGEIRTKKVDDLMVEHVE